MSQQSIRILAVDDNDDALFALESVLVKNGFVVVTASSGKEALHKITTETFDLVILDVMMPGMTGYQVTEAIKADPELKYIPVLMLTANDKLEDVIAGLDRGADDYVIKPFEPNELIARVKAVMRTRRLYQELELTRRARDVLVERCGLNNNAIIGESVGMQNVFSLIEKVKDADVPVLITGASGTGKELVAAAVHYQSPRRDGPFVVQNCSAFNENLLESELFGHVKGAFTGAIRDKQGLFEVADGGTFFLDELGDMSPALQVKLLRVLQDGTFMPVGGTKLKKVNVRIVAATNRDLRAMIASGTFREDLYYRLNVVNIQLPPLKDRRDDIKLLAEHFLKVSGKRLGRTNKILQPETVRCMALYPWPGNIRELENEIERLILLSGNDREIGSELLSPHIRESSGDKESGASDDTGTLKSAIEDLERKMIQEALQRAKWNKSEAARELGISRSNLIAKVQGYGMEQE